MRGRKHREPTGDVFFVKFEGFARKPYQRINDSAPRDLISIECVVKMTDTDRIFREEQRVIVRIPDRERPISDELGKTGSPPLFVDCRDDGNIRGLDGQGVTQFGDQFGAIVQAAVPSDDSTRRKNVRLGFEVRLLRGMERVIQNRNVLFVVELVSKIPPKGDPEAGQVEEGVVSGE